MSLQRAALARQLKATIGEPRSAELHIGTVVSAQTGPPLSLTVTMDGSANQVTGVRYLASYSANAGDHVLIALLGTDSRHRQSWLVLGKIA